MLQWEFTEIQALSGKIKSAFKDKKNHGYFEVYASRHLIIDAFIWPERLLISSSTCVYGKKPESHSS